ncbi:hypothetical protein MYAM1_002487 [Malassezia yamatoensis]|uniref:HTH APSES-type domain-containing protein n=1 Tax=Malassezia yamatoensis TaxID=253288 RepID=A0AAJ5YY24_9BASI|nr:hypothetical protein MYAM1_002487 [Malassezia yamatoensis]
MPPPRRSTPRKTRVATTDSATSSPVKSSDSSQSTPADTPRRTARGRRATAKVAASDTPKTEPSTPVRKRASRASKAAAAAPDAETVPKVEPKSESASTLPPGVVERVHALPTRVNPRLAEVKSRQVKLQVIRREDKEIIIGRIKLPAVNGAEHGFLLKRFDTNAIAGSSMFRLAFPYADAEEESAEMAYLEARFDTDLANGGTILPTTPRRGRKSESTNDAALPPGSTGVRLQGVWIPCEQAPPIAQDYGLYELAQPLLDATAVLLPNEDVPILNPEPEMLAAAAEAASMPLSTPQRQAKRVRTAQALQSDANSSATASTTSSPSISTPMQAAQQLLGPSTPETPATSSRRRTTTRRTRAATAAANAMPDISAPMTPAQIDAQIHAAKALAADIAADSDSMRPNTQSKGKRAAEDDIEEDVVVAPQSQSAVRTLRRNVPRQRSTPLIRAAGALTAAGAVGVGAAAWYAGSLNLATAVPAAFQHLQRTDYQAALHQLQHIDYASALHTLQHNIQNWGTSLFGA